jgi:hypothetical protein
MAANDISFEQLGGSTEQLGGGAQFWVYISPQNNTAEVVKDWTVELSQGDWSGTITSDMNPPSLKTDGLSGEFDVRVIWSQPPKEIVIELEPGPGCQPNIGCNENCASMITIVANEQGNGATYCTTWDAFCSQ